MTTLTIVRHGQSLSNLEKTFAGQSDVPLTELGKHQALLVCDFLKESSFDIIYSSTLSRAYNTVLPLAQAREMQIHRVFELCETRLGEWEGKKIDDVREDYTKWREDPNFAPPGGESVIMVRERFGKAVDKIAADNPNKKILVASHGGCIRLLPSWLEKDETLIKSTPIASNVSVTTVVYENGRGVVKEYAFDEYLGDMVTQFDNGR